MQQHKLNTTSVYRRLSQVGLSVGLLVVVLNMWVDTATRNEQMQLDIASIHTRLMLKQTTQVALRQIKAKKIDELTLMLNDLASDPYILQSLVYDRTGKLIASSQDAKMAHEIYLKQRTLADSLPPYTPEQTTAQRTENPLLEMKMFVTEIMDGDKLTGYLHVSYLHQQALEKSLKFHQSSMQKVLLMMLLCGLIGFMLTRGFSRFSRQSYRIVKDHQD